MTEIPEIWRYEIQYGPEGEDNYAWVYCGQKMIATMPTWNALEIVEVMNSNHTKSPKKKRDAAERETVA